MSKMTKTEREETVEALQAELRASPNVYLTDFTGLDVLRMTDLRLRLRGAGVKYLVVKNTLMQRALAASDITALGDHLIGPTGVVLAGEDAVSAAKVLAEMPPGRASDLSKRLVTPLVLADVEKEASP